MDKSGFKVLKLPMYENSIPKDGETIGRIMNIKGEFTRLAISETHFVAYVDFLVGRPPRGNHYHQNKLEYLYICKGKMKAYFKTYNEYDCDPVMIEVGEGDLIYIEPGCAHAIETIEEGYGIEFSPTKYELINNDVIDYEILKA